MHRNSALLFKKYALPYLNPGLKILEIGPAGIPSAYSKLIAKPDLIWHTIDFQNTTYIAGNTAELTYQMINPYQFPIPDNSYDIVLSGQVMEHVQELWTWLSEIKRVLKPGGTVITIVPVSWPYHEAPLDCWRIYPSGFEALAKFCDLHITHLSFESLEDEEIKQLYPYMNTIPGVSYTYFQTNQKFNRIRMWNRFIRHVPFFRGFMQIPIEVAYDTIAILTKNHD